MIRGASRSWISSEHKGPGPYTRQDYASMVASHGCGAVKCGLGELQSTGSEVLPAELVGASERRRRARIRHVGRGSPKLLGQGCCLMRTIESLEWETRCIMLFDVV